MPESDYCYRLRRIDNRAFYNSLSICLINANVIMVKSEDEISGMTKLLRQRGISSIWLDLFSYNCKFP